jgi:hypothetical protein
MKATFELPDSVFQQVQQRAVAEGRSVEEVVAALLTVKPAPDTTAQAENGQRVAKTLPLLKVRPMQAAATSTPDTQEWCDRLKEAEVRLEVERYEKAFGRKHVDRADS